MGFLSKLFGGDAGAASGKATDDGSEPSPDPAARVDPGGAANEVAPTRPLADAAPNPDTATRAAAVAPARQPVMTGEHRSHLDTPMRAPAASTLAEAAKPPKPMARAPRDRDAAAEPKAAPVPAPDVPAAPPRRGAPEAPRRGQAEASIITSAPALGADPRGGGAPRPGAQKPARAQVDTARSAGVEPPKPAPAPEAAPHRPPMGSVAGETGMLARSRKDRTKSPGFYSNMAPAYGSQTVNPAQASLRRTVMGVAPPPPLGTAEDAPGKAPPAAPKARAAEPNGAAPASGISSPALAEVFGSTPEREAPAPAGLATSAVERQGAGTAAPAASHAPPTANPLGTTTPTNTSSASTATPAPTNAAATSPSAVTPADERAPDSAPPRAASDETDEIEKEETTPGVGHTPSRHDPAVRHETHERELDLLLHFVMDLGLGLATEAWLGPAREALARLKATAQKMQRAALDKALTQLGVELDAPNALGEERRSRVAQQLVLVDLALPRPLDVSGQRLVRERLIVQHLLGELAVTQPLVAQRLRDDSSLTLERLARIDAPELAERVGISQDQAEQALLAFREYLGERARRGPDLWKLGKAKTLSQRLAELEASAQHFESVADSDDAQAKREARRKRQTDIARLSLFLAEWGEPGILGEFERCSVQGKIARLKRWLTELAAS